MRLCGEGCAVVWGRAPSPVQAERSSAARMAYCEGHTGINFSTRGGSTLFLFHFE